MLLVKTKIGPSKIHGIGLFADEFIPKGKLMWRVEHDFDLEFEASQLVNLSAPSRAQFLKYSYRHPKTGKYVLPFDDARFFNHADHPNINSVYPNGNNGECDVGIAAQDIMAGEELTCNYREFDADSVVKLEFEAG
ncbi:MAG: SET domain-containing protein-lysine N-methyltransferase [Candidatus Magasanikbacteria bacterium]|nr:SET domain-containing protein-lysine N-methyltransferase [Candidatus Magasanikbacteria bacterium]